MSYHAWLQDVCLSALSLSLSSRTCWVVRQGGQGFLHEHREQAAVSQKRSMDILLALHHSARMKNLIRRIGSPGWYSKCQSSLLPPTPHNTKLIITAKWLSTDCITLLENHTLFSCWLCDVPGSTLWALSVNSLASHKSLPEWMNKQTEKERSWLLFVSNGISVLQANSEILSFDSIVQS